LACHLQIDADPELVPDSAYHHDADPDFLFDADADPNAGYRIWITVAKWPNFGPQNSKIAL
jgi:hypothetical protein